MEPMRSLLILIPALALAQTSVKSPDGAIELAFSADNGVLAYTAAFRGKPVVLRSTIALDFQDSQPFGPAVKIAGGKTGAIDETYDMPHGKANPVRNKANTLALEVEETRAPFRKMTIEARAYDDGIAFRFLLPSQRPLLAVRLAGERTEFTLAKDGTAFPLILRNFRTSYEDDYHTLPLSGIQPEALIALPFLAELPGVAWVGITEANLDNYAGMYLQRSGRDAKTLVSKLSPLIDEPGLAVVSSTPTQTPWRVVLIGDRPGRLIESNIVINLNPPSQISDVSWIKPGKTAWDWWSGSYAEGVSFRPGMNTDTMKHYVDFAAGSGLEYMLIDAGWAQRGNGPNDSGSDLTKSNPNVDIPAIVAYAKSKKVGIWLWAHFSDVSRQMEEAFTQFEKWGVVGTKIDFMDRDDQWMVNWYRRTLKSAAAHKLMVDFHGAFKPDGVRRTWPNLLTREGVMGAEYNKWSARITPDHNVMLAFTRMLAGPMDYTPGGFTNVTREEFVPRNLKPMVMTTRAHQMALYAIFESALQMVSDYPEIYKGQKEFDYIKAAPSVWDETRVLGGNPRHYITIARRRGKEWWVGSITGSSGEVHDLPLEFLGAGNFTAEVWSDGATPKETVREEKQVNAATVLKLKMEPGGGNAIRIRPR
jgi:alpha-glucosidase